MQCFFCGGQAQDITPGDFDGVVLACPKCKPYEVARNVLGKLRALDPDARADALAKARGFARCGTRPAVTSTCL